MLLPFLIPTGQSFLNISNLQELTEEILFNSDCKSWSKHTINWERCCTGAVWDFVAVLLVNVLQVRMFSTTTRGCFSEVEAGEHLQN